LAGLVVGVFMIPTIKDAVRGGVGMMGWGRAATSSDAIDQRFIEEMIPHHEGAIAMAELGLNKSKRPEILALSKGIIEAQAREIVQMKEWYQTWYGTSVPVDVDDGDMGMMGTGHMMSFQGDVTELSNASDFDLEFIRQMIPHHEMAVMMAQMLATASARPEMQKFAKDIIAAQSGEIEQMHGWYAAWSIKE